MEYFLKKYRIELLVITGLTVLLFLVIFINSRVEHLEEVVDSENITEVGFENITQEDGPLTAISYDLPQRLSFAGEEVPLDRSDLREQIDQELQINIYFHSNTIFLIKRANKWLPQFESILERNGIPDDFKYLPLIESGLLNVVSPANAVGFWQIVKSAGKENGLEISNEVDQRYDPIKAAEAACKYFKKAYEKFGNWTLVAASYNRGVSGMDKAIKKQKVDSYYDLFLNEETSRYVFRILAIKEIIENPERYGFKINPKHLYQQDSIRYVEVSRTIPDLVDFSLEQGTNYKLLKRYNPWLRDDRLTVKRNETYTIALPAI
ncbi:MAG: transglycosylase SLT domain-containing protein [Cyclobacteriaceae bacterium]|nr:transglycosylase SLT domain-containing protein [Cyclobacteriaceae bacterium]